MIGARARTLLDRAREELHRSFTEEHTTHETAGSFSIGVFITMLPTLGTGLIAFVALAWAFDRINKIAMFASVIVFNPVVKWGVYGTSFALGTAILGPVPGVTPASASLSAGPAILSRLLLGNTILAFVAAAVSYVAAHRVVVAYERRELEVVDAVADVVGIDGGPGESGEPDEERDEPDESDGQDEPDREPNGPTTRDAPDAPNRVEESTRDRVE